MPSVPVSSLVTVAPFAASLLSAVVLAFACLLFCCKVRSVGCPSDKNIVAHYRHLVKCYFADVTKALCCLRLRAVPAAQKYTKYWKLCAKYRKNGLKKWSKMCRIFLGIDSPRSLTPQGIQGIFGSKILHFFVLAQNVALFRPFHHKILCFDLTTTKYCGMLACVNTICCDDAREP